LCFFDSSIGHDDESAGAGNDTLGHGVLVAGEDDVVEILGSDPGVFGGADFDCVRAGEVAALADLSFTSRRTW
jgi:hypothetical protein